MNMVALLKDYMNNPKWAGKIFMQDEKTCYIDGLIAGVKTMQEENEQLKAQIEKMKCCENCDGWDYISTGERDCLETCCSNRSNWRLRDRS